MRIISGKYRGRKLSDCFGLKNLRPTTDSNRENLFNILSSSKTLKDINFNLKDSNILDVFCGSGAVSIEALSRGAKSATLIDINNDHLKIAKQNFSFVEEEVKFIRLDVTRKLFAADQKYDFIFIDPPYEKNLIITVLDNLVKSHWIEKDSLIVIEHSVKEDAFLDDGKFRVLDKRKYKNTVFSLFTKK